nr:VOC family protein [uncultured Dyadobacter sp.]
MPAKLKNISAQLLVGDLDGAIAFYIQKLGFVLDFRYEDFYAGIEKDGHTIHLKQGYPMKEGIRRRGTEDLDLVFAVEGISDWYTELMAKDVEIVQPLRQMPYGTEFYIADPDGYVIALME